MSCTLIFGIFSKFYYFRSEMFKKILENQMKKLNCTKHPKNNGLPPDFLDRAKRAWKSLILGFQEKH